MNCPFCAHQIERVEFRKAHDHLVVIRCPKCSPPEPKLAHFVDNLLGEATLKVTIASHADAIDALLPLIPTEPADQLAAAVAMNVFSLKCWAALTELEDGNELRQAINRFREQLARDLGAIKRRDVPL